MTPSLAQNPMNGGNPARLNITIAIMPANHGLRALSPRKSVILSASNPWRCNLMQYALKRPGIIGSRVEQVVSLLMTIVDVAERGEQGGGGSNDKFWQRSLRQILRNGVEICLAARGTVTMSLLHEVITSAPRTHTEVHSPDWQKRSTCYRVLEEAEARESERAPREQKDFELAARYFLNEYPDMPTETRGSVRSTTARPRWVARNANLISRVRPLSAVETKQFK